MSFPGLCWPFDTIPCLVALRLREFTTGSRDYSPVIRRHLAWIRSSGCEPALNLPHSQIDPETGAGMALPRGCARPWRVTLVAQLDQSDARALYRQFARHFWLERVLIAGFAEWPRGGEQQMDADSGLILWGVGLSATGFGLGAALAVGDRLCLLRLVSQRWLRRAVFPALRPTLERMFPFRERDLTGMLMGDPAMFAMAGWCDWGCQLEATE